MPLIAQKREKESNEALREENKLPAVVYGPQRDSQPLKLNLNEFKKVLHQAGRNSLISLEIEDEENGSVLVYEIQRHPISGEPIHVDFYEPPLDQKVEVKVPLKFVGESNAVENLNGTLVRELTRLELEMLPEEIPDSIEVDISSLEEFKDDILVKDLEVPSEVEVIEDPGKIVASVVPPKEVEEELEQPIEEEIEEVETVEEAEETEEIEEAEEEEEGITEEEAAEEEPEQEEPQHPQ